ncbi:ShlB/FhaC/HecB family hemolysin secretion/activation protein [Roseofilum capinflatum]|uniref:ShlB/FhaC/HecB family hemolysin secretion/activation protein n=1 Tax=Roseofilum capinflatum BLCC-M114 TaxID=3022440 RepID=A0ABT7BB60_9CYAN|nr:ShlB/FhaC/HecB family hemolysin secretion/activation protein [Roseofilum capinflatum]MDJ1176410.1 ShlB/FhaC/HecB family hemolysin secretion/activation protein [Roseofilum capinflatum BLCC-M114]
MVSGGFLFIGINDGARISPISGAIALESDAPIERPPAPQRVPLPSPESGDLPTQITVKRFEVIGSTVFSAEELAAITAPFTNRPLSLGELFQVSSEITQAYQDRGYINSGAFIPPQELLGEVAIVEVVEGGIESIEVMGNRLLRTAYIRDRLAIAAQKPFNVNRLLEGLQLLQVNPLIDSLSSELSSSAQPGLSRLQVKITEADSLQGRIIADNSRSPSVGSFRRGLGFTEGNLLGWGDRFSFDYYQSDGSHSVDVSYSFPVNPRNGTLELAYGRTSSEILEDPWNALDLETASRYYEIGFRQPIVQTPREELAIGVTLERQDSETFFGDRGYTEVTALRLFQEWIKRNPKEVLFLRSQLSFGFDRLDETQNRDPIPDNPFFVWRLQSQWSKLWGEDNLVLWRSDLQLATNPLLPLEAFRLGGFDSVRGYRQDGVLTDSGWFSSLELHFRVFEISPWEAQLKVTPFFDYGIGWNSSGKDSQQLSSLGIGLRWEQDHLTAGLQWAIALTERPIDRGTWQDRGVSFFIFYEPF